MHEAIDAATIGMEYSTLNEILLQRAARTPGQVALLHDGQSCTYEELVRLAGVCRDCLSVREVAGRQVILMLDNGPTF
ncbi:MAG: hypothetical protein ACTS6O_14245, partial [Giesbergeria sp.]